LEKDHPFETLATLQDAKKAPKGWPQEWGIDRIERIAQLTVAGNRLQAIDAAQVAVEAFGWKGEQGRFVEMEHGQAGHEAVGQSVGGPPPDVRHPFEEGVR
jgi:hypothetical protein